MRRASFIAAIVALGLALSALPAGAAEENPYWQQKASLPVDTMSGEWTRGDQGRAESLIFGGYNAVGETTHFEGGWVTPWTRQGFATSGAYDIYMLPTTTIDLVVMTRYREKGAAWGSWAKEHIPVTDLGGSGGWGSIGAHFISTGGTIPRFQYEWRIVGDIDGLARFNGEVDLSLK